MAVKSPVDQIYAPVLTNVGARMKSGTRPDVLIGLSVNYGSIRDPGANLRLYDFFKEQN